MPDEGIRTRLYVNGRLMREDTLTDADPGFEENIQSYLRIAGEEPHMIEVELLSEPDEQKRLLRFVLKNPKKGGDGAN